MKKLAIQKVLSTDKQKKGYLTVNKAGQTFPVNKSVPVLTRIGKQMQLEGYTEEGQSMKGFPISFLTTCGKQLDVIKVDDKRYIPVEYVKIVDETVSNATASDTDIISKVKEVIAGKTKTKQLAINIGIGAGLGLLTGYIAKSLFPCCGKMVMIGTTVIGAGAGYLNAEGKLNKDSILNMTLKGFAFPSADDVAKRVEALSTASETPYNQEQVDALKVYYGGLDNIGKKILLDILTSVEQGKDLTPDKKAELMKNKLVEIGLKYGVDKIEKINADMTAKNITFH